MANQTPPAVILAAGEGRRLEPLTNRRPKPMLPVANRPLLEYVVEAVENAGLDRIIFVVGYYEERIRNHFGDGDSWDVDIEYVTQEKQLGTAHALLQAAPLINEPFVLLNGDRIVESKLISDVQETLETTGGPVVSVTPAENPRHYGVVELDGSATRIQSITEKPTGPIQSNLINAGVYGFDQSIFDEITQTTADSGELAITTTLTNLLADQDVHVVQYRGQWLDVSHLWDLLTVNAALAGQRSGERSPESDKVSIAADTAIGSDVKIGPHASIGGGTAIGANATVEANAVIVNSIIFPDTVIEAGAVVRDAVISENTRVGANVTIAGGDTQMVVDGTVYKDIALGGVVGDNATLGGAVTIAPGTVVGDGASIDDGAIISGHIESGAIVRRG